MGRKPRKPIGPQVGPTPAVAAAEVASTKEASPEEWWRELTEDDPITLEPLAALAVPPFGLTSGISNDGATHYFDAVALASYITRRAVFENPLTREPIGREDCSRLDEHIRRHVPHSRDFRVADALDLQRSIRVKAGGAAGRASAAAMRREATAALHGLFSFSNYGRSDAQRPVEGGEGWMVVDDDFQRHVEAEAIAELHAAAAADAARPGGAVPEATDVHFPELSQEATFAGERLAELVQEGEAFALAARAAAEEGEREARRRAAQERARLAAAREARAQAELARKEGLQAELRRQRRREEAAAEAAALAAEARAAQRQRAEDVAKEKLQAAVAVESTLAAQRAEEERGVAKRREAEEKRDAEERRAAKERLEEEQRVAAELEKKEREEEKKRRQKEKQRQKKEQAKAEQARHELEAAKQASSLKCALCGEGILGKNFFEVSGEKFCSTGCVKKKRAAAPA